MSPDTNPSIDLYPISTGLVGLSHPLEILNMLGIGLPPNSTDLQIVDVFLKLGQPPLFENKLKS